jgi:hypothetical protein
MLRHVISGEQFSTMIGKLSAIIDGVQVEANPLSVRRRTYPFVSHDGTIYIHDETDHSSYKILGPIFDDEVIKELFAKCGAEREEAKSRYV